MEVTFVGHACFLCVAPEEPRVLLDPYRPQALGGRIALEPVDLAADVVAISHYHEDHGWFGALPGRPRVADRSGEVLGVHFDMVTVPHDGCCGTQMGLSRIMRFALGGVTVLHPGDLGTPPDDRTLGRLRPVDLLLLPVGGRYTLDPADALAFSDRLAPRWIVPMHFRSRDVDLPMATLEDFLERVPERSIHRLGPTAQLGPGLPEGVVVLDPLRRGRR